VLLHDGAGPGPRLADGTLADLAPIALRLLGVDVPSSMRGTPLVDLRVTSG
jgi:bisphosphoglycerate-independent phosphoglycerate mutase (AlkP superfamily)